MPAVISLWKRTTAPWIVQFGRSHSDHLVPVRLQLQQDWAGLETYEGVMDILRAHSLRHQVRFSGMELGEHASEAG
jgi:hypothetical protein